MDIELTDPRLRQIQQALSPEAWQRRLDAARSRAGEYARVAELAAGGLSVSAALRTVFPDDHPETHRGMFSRYRDLGVEGLIDRRLVEADRKLTLEVEMYIRALLRLRPGTFSHEVHQAVESEFNCEIGESTVRGFLTRQGLSAAVGRPPSVPKVQQEVTELPLAGAELIKAVDLELGATEQLTADMQRALEQLPAPVGEVRDDRGHRDEHGKFLPSYNAAESRQWPELGAGFESVAFKRQDVDLREMRVAREDLPSLLRKVRAMAFLPLLAPGGRWDGLANWRGAQLDELCGYAYQPATLDKFLRGLKYAGMGEVCRETVGHFWFSTEGPVSHPSVGAVVLYVDKSMNPLWTHHWTQCVSVGRLGKRVMPGTSTVSLHSGYGTPLLYHTVSGAMPLGPELMELLNRYEDAAGPETVKRMVVIDREAHSVAIFKDLQARGWLYVVPLQKNVVGPNARFEDLGQWEPFRETDAVQSGWLWLKDSREGEDAIKVRVVARRRGRTGSVAWYATNAPAEDFASADLITAYFDRWPLQEHVYRDANASVSLDAHHGYGKQKIVNYAILDAVEKLDAKIARGTATSAVLEQEIASLGAERDPLRDADAQVARRVGELRDEVERHLRSDPKRAQELFATLRHLEEWRESTRTRLDNLGQRIDKANTNLKALLRRLDNMRAARAKKAARVEIFTVDTELDEILTGFKLTFLNLAAHLQRHYLETRMETETLIGSVLTLPGQRVVTDQTETIRIWQQPRERKFMDAVDKACRRLTDRRLVRDKRVLRFEVADKP